ncbi:MAG TPA: heme o synthase [Caulobacteraceae bacterium]|nr:heme o synthase [Caulobacteraceae bacterium]
MNDTSASMTEAVAQPGRWQDYLQLMKPRVMSLVVFTALTGLVCARAPMSPWLAAIAVLCIAVGAGASGALNMGFEADLDAKMRRTRHRSVPSGRVQKADALGLGVVLSIFSVGLMALATNVLAAGLLAFTIFFYAVVYTLWLKRSTPQNIVIGGLAGALPPVIGWAAASGTAPLNAWLLCAIIFMWTPAHFWSLSLYVQDDYAAAGVPMLPVVAGAPRTRRAILIYGLIFVVTALAPAVTGLGGALYLGTAAVGGAAFVALAVRLVLSRAGDDRERADGLYDVKGPKEARDLFAFSIAYLFALFAALLIERFSGLAPLVR